MITKLEGKYKMSKMLGIGMILLSGLALSGWKYIGPMVKITTACVNTYSLLKPAPNDFNVHNVTVNDFRLGREDKGLIDWLIDEVQVSANIVSYEEQLFAQLYAQLFEGAGLSYAVYRDKDVIAVQKSLEQQFEVVDRPFALEEASKKKLLSSTVKSIVRNVEITEIAGGYNISLTERAIKDILTVIVNIVMNSNELREHVALLYYISQEEDFYTDLQREFDIDKHLENMHGEILSKIEAIKLEQGLDAQLYINDDDYIYAFKLPLNIVVDGTQYLMMIDMDSDLSNDGVARLNVNIDDELSEFNIELDYNKITGVTKINTVIPSSIYVQLTHLKESDTKFVLVLDTTLGENFSLKLDGVGSFYKMPDRIEVAIPNMLLNFSTKGNFISLDMVSADLTYTATTSTEEIANPVVP